jgi:hypothetical protein
VNDDTLEFVDKFCYPGNMISPGSGAEEASSMRVKCAWVMFRKLSPIGTARRVSMKFNKKHVSDWCMAVRRDNESRGYAVTRQNKEDGD